jgi:hypothetical protein
VVVGLWAVSAACAADDSEGEPPPTTEPGPVATADPFPLQPPAAVTPVEPTSLHMVEISQPVSYLSTSISPTEILAETPDGPAVVDLDTATVDLLDFPDGFAHVQPDAFQPYTYSYGEGVMFAAALVCPAAVGCPQPALELWGLDIDERAWTSLGRFDPRELAGDDWATDLVGLFGGGLSDGRFEFALANPDPDPNPDDQVSDPVWFAFDPASGAIDRLDGPTSHDSQSVDQRECTLPGGGGARLDPEQRWALEVRGSDDASWVTVEGDRPTVLLSCGETSVWALAGREWEKVDPTSGEVLDSVSVTAIDEPDVTSHANDVVGFGTDAVTLVLTLHRDLDGDPQGIADNEDVLILPPGASTPLSTDLGAPNMGSGVVGVTTVLPLPDGRMVMLTGGGLGSNRLLVAE